MTTRMVLGSYHAMRRGQAIGCVGSGAKFCGRRGRAQSACVLVAIEPLYSQEHSTVCFGDAADLGLVCQW